MFFGLLFALLPALFALIYIFAFPTFYSSHDYTFRIAEVLLNGRLGLLEKPPSWLNEFVPKDQIYYSVFPLGSILSMLPFVLLKKLNLLIGMPSALIASLIVYFSVYFSLKLTFNYSFSRSKRFFILVAFFLGTCLFANLIQGGAWQIALGFSLLGQLGAFYFIFVKRKPVIAGCFFALAFGNRTELILLAPVFIYFLHVTKKEDCYLLRDAFNFCICPFVLGVLTLFYNYLRFDSIFDFGYARIPGVLEEPWYRDGLFSLSAIPQNFYQMFLAGFRINPDFPYLVPSGFGGSIFLVSPFLIMLFRFRDGDNRIVISSWCSILAILFVLFCHGNPGGWQFSYRYAIELLPWFFLIILETSSKFLKPISFSLIFISIVINSYGTWLFNWTDYVKP